MPELTAPTTTVTIICVACGNQSPATPEGDLTSCPRCAADAVVVQKPDGSKLVDPKLQEAQVLAGRTGIEIGFALAVMGKKLTVEQAKAKANRDATAQQAVTRYGLPLRIAYQVADGKVRPQEAVAQQASEAAAARRAQRQARAGSPMPVFLFLAAVIVLVGGYAYTSRKPDPAKAPPTRIVATETGTEVLYDAKGELTFVKAAGPAQVLNLYCRASIKRRPLEVVFVDSTSARGIFEELTASGVFERRTIEMSLDEKDEHWSVGDRKSPVPQGAL